MILIFNSDLKQPKHKETVVFIISTKENIFSKDGKSSSGE